MPQIKSIYVHVPFCRSFCHFCDFKRSVYNEGLFEQWLAALTQEISCYQDELSSNSIETLYIGGGTPSCLSNGQLHQLLTLLQPFSHGFKEYTIEANPQDISDDFIETIMSYGINRISIGVESCDDNMLLKMNRKHKFKQVVDAIVLCHSHGLHNISADLIYGLVGQDFNHFKRDLDTLLKLDIYHVSLYSLTLEENSVWGRAGLSLPDDDTVADMLEYALVTCQNKGFQRYEVSNFARDNHYSLHNLTYWHYDDFIGLGYGASGKIAKDRYDHAARLVDYIAEPKRVMIEEDSDDILVDYLMMNLRVRLPLSIDKINQDLNLDFLKTFEDQLIQCENKGYLTYNTQWLTMSDYGLNCLLDCLVILTMNYD